MKGKKIDIPPEFYDKAILEKKEEHFIENYYYPESEDKKKTLDYMMNIIKPQSSDRILDIGCAVGTWAFHCAKSGCQEAYGIDYSPESIKLAKKMTDKYGVGDRVKYIVGKVDELPFEDGYFDKIIANSIIEHISDTEKDTMLAEMKRVLKNNGVIYVRTPNGVRDKIGLIFKKILRKKISAWDVKAHYGLISKNKYERIIKKNNLLYESRYLDVRRPYLQVIPFIRYILCVFLVWIIRKPESK
ncbi:MAG: class I SAM-dependent methyltransferase [Elusimicrobia bacterium]|nr:class I SAM-dependent methyltransferase [Elusimicrobiota bacterium]